MRGGRRSQDSRAAVAPLVLYGSSDPPASNDLPLGPPQQDENDPRER